MSNKGSYYNKAEFIGRLGAKPELIQTQSGKTLCKFSVGQSYTTGEGENEKEVTLWHQVVAWDKAAENHAKYLDKGSKVFVEGELKYNKFETEDGQRVKNAEISARQVIYLDSRSTDSPMDVMENTANMPYPSVANESVL
ncbi:MAG: single-stranded DNA-binding protein [Bdellovibrionales bacterium]|nr:single-stranded DNA-binding protein [Bdellovibrionales bacterium]